MSFKKNTKIMLGIKTALLAILMIFGAVAMYIIIDGGNLQDIIKNVQFYGMVKFELLVIWGCLAF